MSELHALSEHESLLQCPICLSTLILPITLTCGHSFCQQCIKAKNFRYVKNVCPICRKKIIIRINNFKVNIILDQLLINTYGKQKIYQQRLKLTKQNMYPQRWHLFDKMKNWIIDKSHWIIIAILVYHLLDIKINAYQFSLRKYQTKALELVKDIKDQNSLDFKFLLFSQFMRILFSNIIIS